MTKYTIAGIGLPALFLQGCSTTFGGSVFVISLGDIILYVVLALMLAIIIGLRAGFARRRSAFWTWFILSLLLTPLAGLIYLLITFTRRRPG